MSGSSPAGCGPSVRRHPQEAQDLPVDLLQLLLEACVCVCVQGGPRPGPPSNNRHYVPLVGHGRAAVTLASGFDLESG